MLHVPNENPDGIKGKKNLIHGRTLNLLPFFFNHQKHYICTFSENCRPTLMY